jgi:hypothetical protein
MKFLTSNSRNTKENDEILENVLNRSLDGKPQAYRNHCFQYVYRTEGCSLPKQKLKWHATGQTLESLLSLT